jgi:hypothetical protein
MIILQDLFNTLATGVYANTALKGTDNALKAEHYGKVVNIINLGIIELYKRFKFLENELTLHITPLTTNYYLRPSRVADLEDITESLYIETPPVGSEGFLNIIKLTAIYDSNGNEIKCNNKSSYTSDYPTIIELATDILQITNFTTAQTLNIMYQAYPDKLTAASYADPTTYEFNIPEIVIDPLISYIAAKTFKPMGSNDSTANADKSASYEQQYELACQKLAMYGLSVQDRIDRETFDSNGWV